MTLAIRRLIALGCIVAAGCATTRGTYEGPIPKGRVLDVRVQEAQPDFATLRFDVEVENPVERDVWLVGFRYGLLTGSGAFLSGAPTDAIVVTAQTADQFSLSDEVAYERLLRALDATAGSDVPFRLEMGLMAEVDESTVVRVPLEFDGFLSLPSVSDANNAGPIQPLDVVYIATPQDVVERMLALARVTQEDVLYDLGCGDGRIAVTAARKHACRAVGYDVDPRWVQVARDSASRHGVADRVTIERKDIFDVDLGGADVIAFYLNPVVNRRLVPKLERLRPGVRIVSHSFPVGDTVPDDMVTMTSREDGQAHRIYLYTTPLQAR